MEIREEDGKIFMIMRVGNVEKIIGLTSDFKTFSEEEQGKIIKRAVEECRNQGYNETSYEN